MRVFHAIHTCCCYGSFSYLTKLMNLTRFILELMTKLTLSQRKYNCFRGNRQCRMRTIKTLPGVDTSLTSDYKIRAEDGLEMFENYTRQSYQLLTIHNEGRTIGLAIFN